MWKVLTIALLVTSNLLAQNKVEKKVAALLGDGYEHFDPGYLMDKADTIKATPILSRTTKGYTIGYEWNGEFIARPDSTDKIAILYPMLMGHEFVSRGEFLEFREWIRDSLAREKMFFGISDMMEALDWIDPSAQELEQFGGDRVTWRTNLNWKHRLDYTDPKAIPILADMYLPSSQRFRNKKTFDLRKFSFGMPESGGFQPMFPVLIDGYNWSLNSTHSFDLYAVMSYLDDQLFPDAPVTNIEPFMAEMYCVWKSEQLSEQMAKTGMHVECRLPTLEEAKYARDKENPAINIQEHDFTDAWRITNNELREFSAAVMDSLRRELLYNELASDELAAKLLRYEDVYFDEASFEFREFDPADRFRNRNLFPFDQKRKVKWGKSPYKETLERSGLEEKKELYYEYEWLDAVNRAKKGDLVPDAGMRNYQGDTLLYPKEMDALREPVGEDLILDYGDIPYLGFGTRDHTDPGRFIHKNQVAIPAERFIPQNDEIADISYEQALAFYNWKYRIDKFEGDESDDWQQFIFPSEEEFADIKKGGEVLYPSRAIKYDFPTFRMVVEIVPN